MQQEYLIEQLGENGRWFIIGRDLVSCWAQRQMRDYACLSPDAALRVVEHPSRRLIVLHDGGGAYSEYVRYGKSAFPEG